MPIKQLLLNFPKSKPKLIQMTFRFKKGDNMKVNNIKFFRNNKPEPLPPPVIIKSGERKRFECGATGKKLERMA